MKPVRLFSRDFTLMVIGQIISHLATPSSASPSPSRCWTPPLRRRLRRGAALSMVPVLLCSPWGACWPTGCPGRGIMWGLDFSTAALAAGYGLLFARGHSVAAVGGMMVLLSAIQALYQPAVQASIPVLVAEEHLPAANGVWPRCRPCPACWGPVLGGVLYGWVGPAPSCGWGRPASSARR